MFCERSLKLRRGVDMPDTDNDHGKLTEGSRYCEASASKTDENRATVTDSRPHHYEYIDTTADMGVKGYGNTLTEMFESCAVGMFNAVSDVKNVVPLREFPIQLQEREIDILLVRFLNALLYYKDTENIVFADCRVNRLKKENDGMYVLNATAYGEPFDRKRHTIGKDVKAATYHKLQIDEKSGYAIVILDI